MSQSLATSEQDLFVEGLLGTTSRGVKIYAKQQGLPHGLKIEQAWIQWMFDEDAVTQNRNRSAILNFFPCHWTIEFYGTYLLSSHKISESRSAYLHAYITGLIYAEFFQTKPA